MLAIQKSDTGYRVFGAPDEDTLLVANGVVKAIPAHAKVVMFIEGKCPHIMPVRKNADDKRSDFALPDYQMYPLNNHEHVVAAIALFGKHDWSKTGGKQTAARRILAAAKRHGIQVSSASEVARAAHNK